MVLTDCSSIRALVNTESSCHSQTMALGFSPFPSGSVSCGSTHMEASFMGYAFDIMAFQHVPAACYEEPIMVTSLSSDSHLIQVETGEFSWYR